MHAALRLLAAARSGSNSTPRCVSAWWPPAHSRTLCAATMSSPSAAKVAVGQLTASGDQQENFATNAALCKAIALQICPLDEDPPNIWPVQEAKAAGCCMLFLPECFSFIGLGQDQARLHTHAAASGDQRAEQACVQSRAAAQPLDGPLMQQYCKLAREQQVWLSLGGFQVPGVRTCQHTHRALLLRAVWSAGDGA